jgi:hypothetical protein
LRGFGRTRHRSPLTTTAEAPLDFIRELWVPILVATLACHIYSAVAWMVLTHHRSDWMRLPLDALRKHPPKPGQYSFPYFDGVNANRPDFAAAMKLGPIATSASAAPPP